MLSWFWLVEPGMEPGGVGWIILAPHFGELGHALIVFSFLGFRHFNGADFIGSAIIHGGSDLNLNGVVCCSVDCFHVGSIGWFWLVLVGLGLYDLGQVIHQEVDSEFVAFAFGVSKFVQHDFIAILNDYLPLAFATHYHTWI